MVPEDEDVGGEADVLCAGGQEPEGRQRIPVAGAAHRGDVDGHGHVLAAREVMEAEAVGRFGDGGHLLQAGVLFPAVVGPGVEGQHRRHQAEVHGGWF